MCTTQNIKSDITHPMIAICTPRNCVLHVPPHIETPLSNYCIENIRLQNKIKLHPCIVLSIFSSQHFDFLEVVVIFGEDLREVEHSHKLSNCV